MYNLEKSLTRAAWDQELERLCILGEGASAVSYLCKWTQPDESLQNVVVKQYKHSFTMQAAKTLWREIDVLESIHHERIPKYLGHYITEQDGRRLLHLVVEHFEGISLEQAMTQHRWTLKESLHIIHQLLQILVYLQSLQPSILHRDIKPSNILVHLVEGEWKVYLIDFGTAIDAIHRTLGATHNAGTIGYMAPEQIVGNPEEASDVYSVGVVAWELLTRQKARGNLVGMTLEWHHKTRGLPPSVLQWLEEMLDESVQTRIQTAYEAMDVLERLPEFDGDASPSLIPEESSDWRVEAARRWLIIAEQNREPRMAACQWLREFGDRCNEGQLSGLFHVLHRVALKQESFRVVEYIQDLVESTPNGQALLNTWRITEKNLDSLLQYRREIASWRWLELAKTNKEITNLQEQLEIVKQNILDATRTWMKYINFNPTSVFRLLNTTRQSVAPVRNEQLIHLHEHSIGLIEVPSLSTEQIWISKMLVTQELYEVIMGYNPSSNKGKLHPVEAVSWWDAVIFCNRLSERCGLLPVYLISDAHITEREGDGFRLPRWRDWKMAARSQQSHRFSGAEDPHVVGWVEKSTKSTQRVAQKEPNPWGFYDMTGNVAEWCWDEGVAVEDLGKRLTAGGSYRDPIEWVRIEASDFEDPRFASMDLGFRISRRLVEKDK